MLFVDSGRSVRQTSKSAEFVDIGNRKQKKKYSSGLLGVIVSGTFPFSTP